MPTRHEKQMEFLILLEQVIGYERLTRKQIIERVQAVMPEKTPAIILSAISHGKNPYYCRFSRLLVEDDKKRLRFRTF